MAQADENKQPNRKTLIGRGAVSGLISGFLGGGIGTAFTLFIFFVARMLIDIGANLLPRSTAVEWAAIPVAFGFGAAYGLISGTAVGALFGFFFSQTNRGLTSSSLKIWTAMGLGAVIGGLIGGAMAAVIFGLSVIDGAAAIQQNLLAIFSASIPGLIPGTVSGAVAGLFFRSIYGWLNKVQPV